MGMRVDFVCFTYFEWHYYCVRWNWTGLYYTDEGASLSKR